MSEVVFNRTAHATLWLAIADRARVTGAIPRHLDDAKKDVLRNMGFSDTEYPRCECFACQYGVEINGFNKCRNCPLDDFDCNSYPFDNVVSYTYKHHGAVSEFYLRQFEEYCIDVAMWPVKEGVICR